MSTLQLHEFIKKGTLEQIRRVITVNNVDEVTLELELANTRLGEIAAVAGRHAYPPSVSRC